MIRNLFTSVVLAAALFSMSLMLGTTAKAQTSMKVVGAELSLDFDKAQGKLMMVGDKIIFVDDEKPESSFAIDRDNIIGIDKDNSVLSIQTKNTVNSRGDEKMRFVFRLKDGSAEDFVSSSNMNSSNIKTVSDTRMPQTGSASTMVYEAEHGHRLYGSCKGRLIVGSDRISYESTDDRDHSRQWLFTDIKKLKRDSPYKLSIKPLSGDGYTLDILGQGIDITDFKKIEDNLATAKANR